MRTFLILYHSYAILLASLLGTEYPFNQYAPILDYIFENDEQITSEHIETLNRISELMKSIDADNLLNQFQQILKISRE
jgi:hypothetical protein